MIVELQEAKTIRKVGLGYLRKTGDWIFPPAAVRIALSPDGKQYTSVVDTNLVSVQQGDTESRTLEQTIRPTEARFLRYRIENTGLCPDWHPGAGKPAWLFVDELLFE